MAIERLSPLAPAFLPEFGTLTRWLMCRNAMCGNFGVHYDGPPPDDRDKTHRHRHVLRLPSPKRRPRPRQPFVVQRRAAAPGHRGQRPGAAAANRRGRRQGPRPGVSRRAPGRQFEGGGWAWLEHPRASLQSVDSAFNAMREHACSLGRPDFRSRPGRGYRGRYVDVDVVLCELWLYLLMRNYAIRSKTRQRGIPARSFRLMTARARAPDLGEVALSFRLRRRHTERISAWTRN